MDGNFVADDVESDVLLATQGIDYHNGSFLATQMPEDKGV